jgi:LPXTG-motif cell wall-anchored protein
LLIFAIDINEISMIVCAFFVGLCGQGIKVTNDALVQSKIKDEFRGRVFAFYDVAVNAGIVSSAIIAAIVLPKTGDSNFLPILIAGAYLFAAAVVLRSANFSRATK